MLLICISWVFVSSQTIPRIFNRALFSFPSQVKYLLGRLAGGEALCEEEGDEGIAAQQEACAAEPVPKTKKRRASTASKKKLLLLRLIRLRSIRRSHLLLGTYLALRLQLRSWQPL